MSIDEQIKELDQVRLLVAADPQNYVQLVPGILPIAQSPAPVLQRWCVRFLADAFDAQDLSGETRRALAVQCVDTLVSLLQSSSDPEILKFTITCASSVYPLLFVYVCINSGEAGVWQKAVTMKSAILQMWGTNSHFGVYAACVKFAEQVISVQSYGSSRPQASDDLDASLSSVPPGHQLIELTVEAEGLGLLDRMLSVFSEPVVESTRITCTVNSLSPLLRTRPSMVLKIMRELLAFDITRKRTKVPARAQLEFRFINKSMELLLKGLLVNNVVPRMASQIDQYLKAMSQARANESLQRLRDGGGQDAGVINTSTTLPPGPASYTALYSLISPSDPLAAFDARSLPLDLAVDIALAGVAMSSQALLENSISIIRARYRNLVEQAPLLDRSALSDQYAGYSGAEDVDDENDDVDALVARNQAQIDAAGDGDGSEDEDERDAALMPAASFHLDLPPKLSGDEKTQEIGRVVDRLISYSSISTTVVSSGAADANKGLDRVALSEWNKDTWITIASRIVTRGLCSNGSESAKDVIREHIFNYIVGNYRDRLEVMVSWLTEEWFSELGEDGSPADASTSSYVKWTTRIFDHVVPLIEADGAKLFIRMLSDLPALDRNIIFKIRSLCIDPYRAKIGFMALRYLIKLRPPVKNDCLDLLENLYVDDIDTRKSAGAVLRAYRPDFIKSIEEREAREAEEREKEDAAQSPLPPPPMPPPPMPPPDLPPP